MTQLPATIPADGTSDVTADLNAWLNDPANYPDGLIELPLYGRLGHTGQVRMEGQHDFEWRGRGCTFVDLLPDGDRGDSHLAFVRCQRFVVRATIVQGTAPSTSGYDPDLEAQHGFHFLTSDDWTLSKCHVRDVWGDKVYVGMAGPYEPWCHNWTVEYLKGGQSHRSSLVVAGGANGVCHDNDWGTAARTGIDMEPNSVRGGCVGLEITDDVWGRHGMNWVASAAGKPNHPGGPVTGITLRGCQAEKLKIVTGGNHPLADWTVDGCQGSQGEGNPSGAVMQFHGMTGTLVITNNHNGLQARRPPPPMRIARWEGADGTDWGTTATVTYEGNTRDIDA